MWGSPNSLDPEGTACQITNLRKRCSKKVFVFSLLSRSGVPARWTPGSNIMSAKACHTSPKNRLSPEHLKKWLRVIPTSLLDGFRPRLDSFWRSFRYHFERNHRNGKSVFGLRRRVRIAYPSSPKTLFSLHFSSRFVVLFTGTAFL